jgi:uncharacterized protein YggE
MTSDDGPEIIVRGSAEVRVLPDRAALRVDLDGDGPSRDEAYRQAAPLAEAVDRVVEAHRARLARVVTAALAVQPRTRWRRGENIRTGWRASRTTLLDVVDFAGLGDLFAELAAAGGAVAGPTWHVDPTNPAHDEARRQAAADARRRADAYAAALGLRVLAPAWVAEPGLRRGGGGGDGPPMARAMGAAGSRAFGAAEQDVIDVNPEEVVVAAAVEVGFRAGPRTD